jgi:hypothetical protein
MYTGHLIADMIATVERILNNHAEENVEADEAREFTDYQLREHLYGSDNAQG